ncbi:MAG: glycoside hydrolase family 95 protein [Phycicoccus sp.]|nr:glycoside hydrolase family 95 protein [Phycicoccus sp.]
MSPTPAPPRRRLTYAAPAANINEALPIGNGRLGAMIYGGVAHDRISLNDDRLWAGIAPPDPVAQGPAVLAQARELFRAGERGAAQRLLESEFTTAYNEPFLPAGSVVLDWQREPAPRSYERELDLGSAIAGVVIADNGIATHGEHFVSADDEVIVARYAVTQGHLPTVRVRLDAPLRHSVAVIDGDLVLRGDIPIHVRWSEVDDLTTPENTVTYDDARPPGYAVRLRIADTDGRVQAVDDSLMVRDATRLTLLVAIATNHRGPDHVQLAGADLDAAAQHPYAVLRERHVERHREFFDRVQLTLPTDHAVPVDTGARLRAHHAGRPDPDLMALQFDLGRYLLLASSRPGSMPAHLQGVWNESVTPPWWDNYTLNINLQMNYWPAQSVGLPECAQPLRDFVEALSVHGRRTAREQYGLGGWVAHHQADGHLQATPVGYLPQGPIPNSAQWALWPFGGAWLALDLLDHLEYSTDPQAAAAVIPLALGAAEFLLDWLIDDPDDARWLATYPSTSPENTYVFRGERIAVAKSSTMDIALTRALFTACLNAAALTLPAERPLGAHELGILDRIDRAMPRLPEPQIAADGRLVEYDDDYPEGEHPHRHISHLFDLCPGRRIHVEATPELAQAAARALDARGDSGTGWSLAWKARCRARLHQPDRAYGLLHQLLTPVDSAITDIGNDGGGTYPNLLMCCPPFMIEANFGYVSVLLELFLQDHAGVIELLPACPDELATGTVRGVRLRGGGRLAMSWSTGRVASVTVECDREQRVRFRVDGRLIEVDLAVGDNDLGDVLGLG